jgi:hypothetical protein
LTAAVRGTVFPLSAALNQYPAPGTYLGLVTGTSTGAFGRLGTDQAVVGEIEGREAEKQGDRGKSGEGVEPGSREGEAGGAGGGAAAAAGPAGVAVEVVVGASDIELRADAGSEEALGRVVGSGSVRVDITARAP